MKHIVCLVSFRQQLQDNLLNSEKRNRWSVAYVKATHIALFNSAEGGGYVTAGVCVLPNNSKNYYRMKIFF